MLSKLLSSMFKQGAFLVRLPDGALVSVNGAREQDGGLIVHVRTMAAAARIAANPGLAVGEAYMDGDLVIERGELFDLLAIASARRAISHRLSTPTTNQPPAARSWRRARLP